MTSTKKPSLSSRSTKTISKSSISVNIPCLACRERYRVLLTESTWKTLCPACYRLRHEQADAFFARYQQKQHQHQQQKPRNQKIPLHLVGAERDERQPEVGVAPAIRRALLAARMELVQLGQRAAAGDVLAEAAYVSRIRQIQCDQRRLWMCRRMSSERTS